MLKKIKLPDDGLLAAAAQFGNQRAAALSAVDNNNGLPDDALPVEDEDELC